MGTVILILLVTLLFKVTILCNFSSACHLQHYHLGTNKTAQSSSRLPYQFLEQHEQVAIQLNIQACMKIQYSHGYKIVFMCGS